MNKIITRTLYSIILLILLIPSLSLTIAWLPMGSNPQGERLERIIKSPQYNQNEQKLSNPVATPLSTGRPWTSILYDFFFNGEARRPPQKLPEVIPSAVELKTKSNETRFIWFGHSTILLELDGKRILIDPIFSDYASPLPLVAKRFQPSVLSIDEIKDVDIILISHDHYDHLDYKTIKKLKNRDLQYIVPLGVGAHLEYWGIDKSSITELDWWDSSHYRGLTITCAPSQHFSGRGIDNQNSTLWAAWAIRSTEGDNQNIFFSGDSGYGAHYKEIGNRLGPFDITFIENGAYSTDWKFVHQLPEEGVQAHIDLKGKLMVPVHWGMFDLALHSWYDPIVRVNDEAMQRGVSMLAPKLGQVVTVNNDKEIKPQMWWSPFIQLYDTQPTVK